MGFSSIGIKRNPLLRNSAAADLIGHLHILCLLYTSSDKAAPIKRSEENPVIYTLYNNGGLLEGREHELLHVHYAGAHAHE